MGRDEIALIMYVEGQCETISKEFTTPTEVGAEGKHQNLNF